MVGKTPMAAITAYFDASGSPASSDILALVGLASTQTLWERFDSQWNDCLEAFGVPAFHMKNFAHSVREFSGWSGDQPRRRRFLNGLIWAIEENVEFTVESAINMDDYRDVNTDLRLNDLMRPYTMALPAHKRY